MTITRDKCRHFSTSPAFRTCFVLCSAILSQSVWAKEEVEQSPRQAEAGYSLGIGAFSSESIYVGGENQNRIFPLLSAHYKRFYFQGFELGANLYRNHGINVKFGVGGDFVGDKDRGDSDELADMEELDISILARLSMEYRVSVGLWKVGLSQDISGIHDGYSLSAGYSLPYKHGNWIIKPELNASWQSEKTLDYYYGVNIDEATLNRAAYKADAGIVSKLGLQVGYGFTPRLMLLGRVQHAWYGDEISNSPIVAVNSASQVSLMLNYWF
ncbi:hypothetical protein Misp06_02689 [Microbulbifer sp. NBRC 101763]|uniref:MipA/OmpV family protein n=1 Tax=Microbulbifer sp. NBRC 101763 TaxID=1113820 RepID=UPI0030B24C79